MSSLSMEWCRAPLCTQRMPAGRRSGREATTHSGDVRESVNVPDEPAPRPCSANGFHWTPRVPSALPALYISGIATRRGFSGVWRANCERLPETDPAPHFPSPSPPHLQRLMFSCSADELAGMLPRLGVAQGPAKVRDSLRRHCCFSEVWRGRFQVGHAA